jgi:protein-S-isoprenylcysteine O-methyltransferase Ste14
VGGLVTAVAGPQRVRAGTGEVLVDRGPYRWVRHPLYSGEIVSSLGLALLAGTSPAVAVWLGFCFLQAYRALREEQLLVAAMPAYRGYRARTAALFPGLF